MRTTPFSLQTISIIILVKCYVHKFKFHPEPVSLLLINNAAIQTPNICRRRIKSINGPDSKIQ